MKNGNLLDDGQLIRDGAVLITVVTECGERVQKLTPLTAGGCGAI